MGGYRWKHRLAETALRTANSSNDSDRSRLKMDLVAFDQALNFFERL